MTNPTKDKPTLADHNYYGLKHEKIYQKLEGDVTYVGTFCVKGEYPPRAVYHDSNPDLEKGHKEYVTLQRQPLTSKWYISGLTKEEIEEFRFQDGICCLKCNDVIYSVTRHDYRSCSCKNCAIDGGRSYGRIIGSDWKFAKIDLLTGSFELSDNPP